MKKTGIYAEFARTGNPVLYAVTKISVKCNEVEYLIIFKCGYFNLCFIYLLERVYKLYLWYCIHRRKLTCCRNIS